MADSSILQLPILDLVPFGNPGGQTGFYALRLAPPGWENWQPGQFVMIRPVECGSEMLWARPFSICTAGPRDLVVFFQVRGRATAQLAKLQPGALVNVWGPLGNSLTVEPKNPTLILVGGIGIAPFVGYVQAHPKPSTITMEFGHRMPLECYPFDSLAERVAATAHLETNAGDREAFLALIEKRIADFATKGLVLACGPTPFLQAVKEYAARHNARAQLSLETKMACGVGACLGCVVKAAMRPPGGEFPGNHGVPRPVGGTGMTEPARTERHHVQTCTCGPVFWANDIELA